MSNPSTSQQQGLTVDIRVFLLIIVSAMAVSFGVGVAFGPTAESITSQVLPKVTSVDLTSELPSKAPGNDDDAVHEPAGQVCEILCVCLCFCLVRGILYKTKI